MEERQIIVMNLQQWKRFKLASGLRAYLSSRPSTRSFVCFRKSQRGFTLIEVLVVLVIVFILAAVLMPNLKNALETSKRTTCMANLRQFGTLIHVMMADNDGWLGKKSSDPTDYGYWPDILPAYMGLNTLDGTPFGPKSNRGCPSKNPQEAHWAFTPYGVNSMFTGYYSADLTADPKIIRKHSLSEVKHASRICLAVESWSWYVDGSCASLNPDNYPVHQGKGYNFFFVDGHAAFLTVSGSPPNYDSSEWYRVTPPATEWYPYNGSAWNSGGYSGGLWGN